MAPAPGPTFGPEPPTPGPSPAPARPPCQRRCPGVAPFRGDLHSRFQKLKERRQSVCDSNRTNIEETKRVIAELAPYLEQMGELLQASGKVLELQLEEMIETENEIEVMISRRDELQKELNLMEDKIESQQAEFFNQVQGYKQRTEDLHTLQTQAENIISDVKLKLAAPHSPDDYSTLESSSYHRGPGEFDDTFGQAFGSNVRHQRRPPDLSPVAEIDLSCCSSCSESGCSSGSCSCDRTCSDERYQHPPMSQRYPSLWHGPAYRSEGSCLGEAVSATIGPASGPSHRRSPPRSSPNLHATVQNLIDTEY